MKQPSLLPIPHSTIREYVQLRLRDFALRQAARDQKRAEHTSKQKARAAAVTQFSSTKIQFNQTHRSVDARTTESEVFSMKCWVCGQLAVWKNQSEREKTQDSPAVYVEYWACDKCIPFSRERKNTNA